MRDALVETLETERLKTLSVWSQFADGDLPWRPAPRGRTVLEQFVHQCQSEDGWFVKMLGIDIEWPVLPAVEDRHTFLAHYAVASARRVAAVASRGEPWFGESALFFSVPKSRGWILIRRIAHTAHHRGQLTAYLRMLGRSLYSTYGPTADTGGLPAHGAVVIYRYPSVDALLEAEPRGGEWPALPGPGDASPTER